MIGLKKKNMDNVENKIFTKIMEANAQKYIKIFANNTHGLHQKGSGIPPPIGSSLVEPDVKNITPIDVKKRKSTNIKKRKCKTKKCVVKKTQIGMGRSRKQKKTGRKNKRKNANTKSRQNFPFLKE